MDPYRLSRAAQRAIEAAENEAIALRHGRLESGHVLLGLLAEKGAASVVLRRAGLDLAGVRRAVDEAYDGLRDARARDLEKSAPEMRELLEVAKDEADVEGEHDIPLVRLFLAATADEGWSAYRALQALGLDVEKARDAAIGLARDEVQGSLPE